MEHFEHNSTTPKCCRLEEILFYDSATKNHSCVLSDSRFGVVTSNVLPNFESDCTEKLVCEDVRRNDFQDDFVSYRSCKTKTKTRELKMFPKCCPADKAYSEELHSCVEVAFQFAETSENSSLYIKSGLSECNGVITDHKFHNLSSLFFDSIDQGIFLELHNDTVQFSYGNYCVDRLNGSDEAYVVRGCHKGYNVCSKRETRDEVSGKRRCIRKCCPDGQIYKNGATCKDDFRHGIEFGEDERVVDSTGRNG